MRYGLCVANIGTYADPRNVRRARRGGRGGRLGGAARLGPPRLRLGPARRRSLGDARRGRRPHRPRSLLGTNVTPLPRRRPHVLAHQVATLDVLSGGRVVFGAGIGGVASEFTAFGEPARRARRGRRCSTRGSTCCARLWSGEQVIHHGRHYTVDGVTLAPRPVQERLPIWIGGNSAPALRRAARFDGWAADTTNQEGMTTIARATSSARSIDRSAARAGISTASTSP